MKKQLTATEVEANLFELLDAVENGEEFEIMRDGRTVAFLLRPRSPRRLLGRHDDEMQSDVPNEEPYSTGGKCDVESG